MKTTILVNAFFIMAVCVSCQKDVPPAPVARFESLPVSVDRTGALYSFKNTSENATVYNWTFGDGIGTTEHSPLHRFQNNGLYEVILTAKGDGGENTFKQSIQVSNVPTTGNFIFWSRVADKGNITVSVSGKEVGTITVYQIAAGIPECKTTGFVTVTLPEGTYSFTAKSQGLIPLTWSSTFQVVNGLCRNTELQR